MVSRRVLNKIFFRSFFLQGTWNFERMQNLGFCFAVIPALKEIYGEGERLKEPLRRHLEFFNTHPYMASPIIGAVIRMEEEAEKGSLDGEGIKTIKTGIMGSYGAIGDSLFWGAIKPFASIIAVISAAMGFFMAPLLFLGLYNIPHLKMRIFGLYGGYKEGLKIFDTIKHFNFVRLTKKIKVLTSLAAGVLLAVWLNVIKETVFPGDEFRSEVASIVLFLILYFSVKRGVSTVAQIYIFLFLTLVASGLSQ